VDPACSSCSGFESRPHAAACFHGCIGPAPRQSVRRHAWLLSGLRSTALSPESADLSNVCLREPPIRSGQQASCQAERWGAAFSETAVATRFPIQRRLIRAKVNSDHRLTVRVVCDSNIAPLTVDREANASVRGGVRFMSRLDHLNWPVFVLAKRIVTIEQPRALHAARSR
jgi:hypothetical protein